MKNKVNNRYEQNEVMAYNENNRNIPWNIYITYSWESFEMYVIMNKKLLAGSVHYIEVQLYFVFIRWTDKMLNEKSGLWKL